MPFGVAAVAVSAYSAYQGSKQQGRAQEAAGRDTRYAADISAQVQREGLAMQKEQQAYQREQYEEFKPYLTASMEDYRGMHERYVGLLDRPETYKKSPGYMFRLKEGLKAIGIPDGGSSFLSGSQIKAASRYAQDYATQDYNQALARVSGLADPSQGAAMGAMGGLGGGSELYGSIGRTLMQGGVASAGYSAAAGAARAAGTIGMGRAIAGGISQYGAMQRRSTGPAQSYYGKGQTSGYGGHVSGDAYGPAYQ